MKCTVCGVTFGVMEYQHPNMRFWLCEFCRSMVLLAEAGPGDAINRVVTAIEELGAWCMERDMTKVREAVLACTVGEAQMNAGFATKTFDTYTDFAKRYRADARERAGLLPEEGC